MSLKKQEEKLMKKIEEKGLERRIRHLRPVKEVGTPVDVEIEEKKYKNTRAITLIFLVTDDYNSPHPPDVSDDEDINYYLNRLKKDKMHDIKSLGYAICSVEDQFNKQLGRIIATGRALKDL